MPKICLETADQVENIVRPVTMQVVRQMAGHFGLPPTTPIRFAGGTGSLPLPGSTLDDKSALNRLPGDSNITIEVEESYVEENALSVGVLRPENIVFFSDAALDIYLKPVYQRVANVVSVTYTCHDKTSADGWLSTMKRRVSQEFDEVLHYVDYHYPIPLAFMAILLELHRLRENVAPYGETIGQYLRNHFSPKFTAITDQAGNNTTLVIRESQIAIPGWYDFNASPPKPEKPDDTGVWTVGFSYTFHYDRPESVVMQYPLMVHNQLLSTRFRSDVKPAELEDVVQNPSLSIGFLKDYTFESRMARAWMAEPGIPIPYFDEWLPSYTHPSMQTIMRIMLQVDAAHPKNLLNLGSLGSWKLKESALQYIRDYPIGLTQPYESIFNVSLHRRYSMMDCKGIVVSTDLDLFAVRDLDLREPYHLHFTMLYDPRRLSPLARRRLCKHGSLAIAYLIALDPSLADGNGGIQARWGTSGIGRDLFAGTGFLPQLLADGSISYEALSAAIDYVSHHGMSQRSGNAYFWNLVGAFTVVAH